MDPEAIRFAGRAELAGDGTPRAERLGRCTGLWIRGSIEGLGGRTVAVVGCRAPSDAGRALARTTAAALGRAGFCVLSGLALGIDGAAHLGALDARAPTIGVLGGGHDCFFPRRHRELAERMVGLGGAVLSPFPPSQPAYPAQFLARNGIVAALSDAVVIVEAAARSGALNTASWAAAMSVPVFAFPGDVDRPKVAGCLALIRDGATLVRNADDILEGLGVSPAGARHFVETDRSLTDLEHALLGALSGGEQTLESLVTHSSAAVPAALASLVRLELLGRVESRTGGRYALRPRSQER